ncbi:MAG TPA: type II CAAX endopeptidase family protein [Bacilli bacterium]|nr:type II CAAX endopeptidase family protein [Bacilli bacterium]
MNIEKKKKGDVYFITLLLGMFLYLLLTFIYIYSALMAVSIVDNSPLASVFDENNPYYAEILSIVQMMFNLPLIGFFIYVLRHDFQEDWKRFKMDFKKNLSYIGLGIIACYVLTAAVSAIYELLGITGTSENQQIINDALFGKGKVPMMISVILFAPFVEEVLFRKLLFGTLEEKFKLKPIVAIIASTLVFSLIHVSSGDNIIYIFQYLPLAFVITYSYYKSERNIFVPMGIHFLNNLISVLVVYFVL